jgi:hypothetical protein
MPAPVGIHSRQSMRVPSRRHTPAPRTAS